MKSLFRRITSVMVVMLLIVLSVTCAFAAGSKQAESGVKVEYTLSIADSYQNINGIHMELFYDNTVMKIDEINADNLSGNIVINADEANNGRITILNGLVNGAVGLKCKEKTDLVTVTFTTVKEGNAEVQYYIPYLYDDKIENIRQFTLTEKLIIDGKTITDGATPVLANGSTLKKYPDFDKGDFENNKDGKLVDGENISPVTTNSTESHSTESPTQTTAPETTTTDVFAGKKKMEYTFSIGASDQKLSLLELLFIYNHQVMELVDVDVTGVKNATVIDTYGDGRILITKDYDNPDDAPLFEKNTEFVKLTFAVSNEDEAIVKFYPQEILDTDGKKFEDFKLYHTSKMDGNIKDKDKETEVASKDELLAKYPFLNKLTNNNKSGNDEDESKSNNILVIGIVIGVVVIALVVVLVVLKAKSDKKNNVDDLANL